MATPSDTIKAFFAVWEQPNGFVKSVNAYFTPDTVWENVGMCTTTGPEEAIAAFPSMVGDDYRMRVDDLLIATVGNKVMTQRLDQVLGPDGENAVTIPVMGTFEVEGDKIVAWSDYFDTARFTQQ